MFEKFKEKREQQRLEEQARIEEARRVEKEKLMSLSEKELLIEIIFELKKLNRTCSTVSSKCDDISTKIMLYNN